MNILFAPTNIGSMPAITAEAMNRIPGITAKYITTNRHKYLQDNAAMIDLAFKVPYKSFKEDPFKNIMYIVCYNLWYRPYKLVQLCRWIMWADVIHWSWNSVLSFNFDLRLAKFFKKKRFIEWVGSEMRIPEVTMLESKWYKEVFNNGYEYSKMENREKSYRLQEKFAKYGFVPILVPEMHLFLKPGLFKKVFATQYRIFQKDKFPEVFFPKPGNDKLVIAHSPSAKFAKGSGYIIDAVEKLKRSYNIEFVLLNNVPHDVVLETMKRCDIFIDQIILGSYAAAAIEAMSLGKPTVAYIMPGVYRNGTPVDCPVVNANPDNLAEKLTELIDDPELRYNIGVKSRRYVEAVHNADTLARQLLEIYNTDIDEFK
jgi:glycosyltransferase involved in cell wall biosynthesis